jgi:hypothetical protein
MSDQYQPPPPPPPRKRAVLKRIVIDLNFVNANPTIASAYKQYAVDSETSGRALKAVKLSIAKLKKALQPSLAIQGFTDAVTWELKKDAKTGELVAEIVKKASTPRGRIPTTRLTGPIGAPNQPQADNTNEPAPDTSEPIARQVGESEQAYQRRFRLATKPKSE